MKRVILDCDPGHDDAFAVMLAAHNLDLLGITTIGGNCSLENVTTNALKVLEVIERTDIPVFAGHAGPLVAPLVTAPQFHGPTGLDGPELPDPVAARQERHGVDFIVDTLMSTDAVTLIATGPLTNIAAAINREPRIIERVRELSIMGGSATFGNWTPTAEFNVFVDPEAAHRVFNSGMQVKMCGLNLTRQCLLTREHLDTIGRIGTRAARFAVDLGAFFLQAAADNAALPGAVIHDACAAAWIIDPALITAAPMHVTVELKGEFTRGMTVCDSRHLRTEAPEIDLQRTPTMAPRGAAPNAEVALDLDFAGFMQLLLTTLAALP